VKKTSGPQCKINNNLPKKKYSANRRSEKRAEFVAVRSIPSWQHNSIWSSVNFGNFNKYSSCAREQPSRKIHFPNLAKTKRKQQNGEDCEKDEVLDALFIMI